MPDRCMFPMAVIPPTFFGHAEVVQVIGRKFSLYRESSRKDIEKIKLV